MSDMPTLLMLVDMRELRLKGARMAFVEERTLFVVLVDGTIVPSEFVVMSDNPPPPFHRTERRVDASA